MIERPPFAAAVIGEYRCCLRLQEDGQTYWRDAGAWRVGTEEVDGKLQFVRDDSRVAVKIEGLPVIPVTKAEWAEDNDGYINGKQGNHDEDPSVAGLADDTAF